MNNIYYQIKKYIVFTLILSFTLLISSVLLAQQASVEDIIEKQLKIFHLSYFLEEENSFPVQNAYFKNAIVYLENDHIGLAINELEKIEYNSLYVPFYLKSQLLSAQCYEKLQRWESAIRIYNDLLNQVPVMQEYVAYLLANAYMNTKDVDSSQKTFQEIISKFSQTHSGISPLVHHQLALLYKNNNLEDLFWQQSNLALETSLEEKFKAQILLEMSEISWEKGEYINSLGYLKELIEKRYEREKISSQENLYIDRFQIIYEQGDHHIPSDILLFFADTIFNYRRYKEAEIVYDEIIERDDDQVQLDLAKINYNKARVIYYQGDYDRAMEQCSYVLNNFSQEDVLARTLYLYAGCLLSTGKRDIAGEKYKEVIKMYPENQFAHFSYFRLSEISFLQDKEAEGIQYLKQLLIDYPESTSAQEAAWSIARYYTKQNSIAEALPYYRYVYEAFPDSSQADDALFWLGKLLYLSEKTEGLPWLEKLTEQYPDSYYAFRIPLDLQESNYQLEEIIRNSRKTSVEEFKRQFFPQNKKAQLSAYRAELLIFLNLYQEAVQELYFALQQESNNPYLLLLLTKSYAETEEYYRSNSYAQSLLNTFLSDRNRDMPILLWEYTFPIYYKDLVQKKADDYRIDPYLVWSIMREESHFNTWAESRVGARGLMQIIHSTGEWIAQKLNYEKYEPDALFNPEFNINLGAWYLQYLLDRFDDNNLLVIAGYNAGPGITDKWLETLDISDIDVFVEDIPYEETREHIKKVMRTYFIYRLIYQN